ncbi:MAG TPA: ATP-binding protein [Sphingomicrobium sp.]|nr:ATP-binding protein [Sphingomicrobium sp.]
MSESRSERALILAPTGRDSAIAAEVLAGAGIESFACQSVDALLTGLALGAGFVLVTEEALLTTDLRGLSVRINEQPQWSDLPFVLLTHRGGGLERNPDAGRFLETLGNVTFLERPFHPTTLVSLGQSALRARRRQYDARGRLEELQQDIHARKAIEEDLRQSRQDLQRANETLEARVEERTRERQSALAKLHEAQKLETLGQLTGGVAHDFNNLLTPVIGNLDLLRRRLPGGDKSHRLIDGALQAASRAGTLVQRLLAFARRQDLQPRAVEISGLLDGMTDLLQRSIGPTVKVRFDSEAGLPPARVDPNQLELAILNLAINARDAMPTGGTLWIEARSEHVTTAGTLQPGDYVTIIVRDTGSGMTPETMARAIEPFFSTKGIGQGTGLGLSMVHGLAAQLGGMLGIKSKLDKGTTATIWLPVSSEMPDAEVGDEAAVTVARQVATILLVDDEDLVRTGTADMLGDLGYEVVQASSGAEALRMLRSGVEVDLMITDFLMPGMNGVALIEHATALAKDMKVLLVTGYSTIAEGPGAHLPRLGKPYRQAELSRRVADLLSQQGGARVLPFERQKSSGQRD